LNVIANSFLVAVRSERQIPASYPRGEENREAALRVSNIEPAKGFPFLSLPLSFNFHIEGTRPVRGPRQRPFNRLLYGRPSSPLSSGVNQNKKPDPRRPRNHFCHLRHKMQAAPGWENAFGKSTLLARPSVVSHSFKRQEFPNTVFSRIVSGVSPEFCREIVGWRKESLFLFDPGAPSPARSNPWSFRSHRLTRPVPRNHRVRIFIYWFPVPRKAEGFRTRVGIQGFPCSEGQSF